MTSGPSLSPTIVKLTAGGSQQFALPGKYEGQVRWLVNGTPGGSKELGTVDESGLYLGPARPSRTEVVVEADLGSRSLWATVIMETGREVYRYTGSWNQKGENLIEAHGIGLDPSGNILIADPQQSRVLRFSSEGQYLGEIGNGRGKEPGYFDGPRDVVTDPDGNIYVADGNNCRIQVFDPEGRLRSSAGMKGSGSCEFLRPHSLDIGPDGNVYVIDVDNHRVTIHDSSGKLLGSWGAQGTKTREFWAPHGLAVDPNGDVFVIDFYGRCQKFTKDGELLLVFANPSKKSLPIIDSAFGAISIGQYPTTHGYYRYHAMASDVFGNIYLMSRNTIRKRVCSVDKYSNNGDLVTRITLPPEVKRRMGGQGADVTPEGRLYVSDTGPKHAGVMIFDPD